MRFEVQYWEQSIRDWSLFSSFESYHLADLTRTKLFMRRFDVRIVEVRRDGKFTIGISLN